MTSTNYQVVNGPSREILFDRFRLVEDERTAAFDWIRPDGKRQKVKVLIEMIAIDIEGHGRTGNDWIIVGRVELGEGDNTLAMLYNTQTRTGEIRFCVADALRALSAVAR